MKKLFIFTLPLILFLSCKDKNTSEVEPLDTETKVEQITDMHTSQNSLDWQGTYQGILPCADCEGIQTKIVLNNNNTYAINRIYLGKAETVFEETGDLQWTEDGGTVVLMNAKDGNTTLYKVGENHLKQLDIEGYPIEGELAEMYVLQKAQ